MLRRCAPRQGTFLTRALSRPRSKWVPGRTVKGSCVWRVPCAEKWQPGCMVPGELRWLMNEQFLWPGGNCVKSGEWRFQNWLISQQVYFEAQLPTSCRYWVYRWSSHTGLIRSHRPDWTCPGLPLCWLNWFWGTESYMGVTVQHTGGGCFGSVQLSEGTGKLNTKPKLSCIVGLLYSTEIVCKSDDFHREKYWKGLNSRIDFWPLLL